ncbi:PREDICTED: uncharacterized protein LOC105456462 [Wasmannia auropunctata]|uniref:uncharacterized protein LOC105456462 n=1 Tax=Wasmannia auropunctata TaxID=64793 RepID=UPI0005F09BC9|nr:PREDICTED: uncharacterized protein LOC105456462 [Wasmannia auropunctata]
MPRVIATSLLILIFVIMVHSEHALKCYMCTSLSNEGCGLDFTTNSLQPVECTNSNIMEWQGRIRQHNNFTSMEWLFNDNISQQSILQDMACSKIILNIGKKDVVIRMCKSKLNNPCKTMEEKQKSNVRKMEQCELCFKDACNSTTFLSSKIFYIFLSFLCTRIVLYR